MKLTKKNSIIIYVIIALALFGVGQYQKNLHNDDFTMDKVNITVGEIYSAYSIKQSEYCDYVYNVNNTLYKCENNSFSADKIRELRKRTELNKVVKYPVIYNKANPKLNFILNIELNDSLELGNTLSNEMISEEILKSRVKYTYVKSASTDKDDLSDYMEFITNANNVYKQ